MAGINSPNNLNGINPLAYIGTTASASFSPPSLSMEPRNPTVKDWQNFKVGAIWVNSDPTISPLTARSVWILVAVQNHMGTWIQFTGGSGGALTSLRADDGNIAMPLLGIINIHNSDLNIITTASTPNTVTLNLIPLTPNAVIQTNGAGVLTASAGTDGQVLIGSSIGAPAWNTITAGTGVTIANGHNIITISADSEVFTLTGNTGGSVSPLAGNINTVGDGIGITIAGNPGTHTLTASLVGGGNAAQSFPTNSGIAAPVAGILNIIGAGAVSTSGAGNTITITASGMGTGTVQSVIGGENINITGTPTVNPVVNLNEVIRWPNTTADGLHGAIYLGATCAAGSCTGGTLFMHNFGPFSSLNTFLGSEAGNLTNTGIHNVGIGTLSLNAIAGSSNNTCVGNQSCASAVTGYNNSAFGFGSGARIVDGFENCLFGVATGTNLTSGSDNSVFGTYALGSLTTGTFNVILGYRSGSSLLTSESNNVYLGSNINGVTGESNVLRIGFATGTGSGGLIKSFIAGIAGITTDVNDAVPVLISSSTGQLGVTSSSIRYKDNIKDLPESKEIYSLRPVIFNYKKHEPESKSVGLIAEEVHKVMPQLVIYKDNEPDTIKYADINIMMLAEIQKLEKRIALLEK